MEVFNVVGMMVGLEKEGLTKNQVIELLKKMPSNEAIIPFKASHNNSVIYGYITGKHAENHLDSVIETAQWLCSDFDNERTDKTYLSETGIEMFIDREAVTIRDVLSLCSYSSHGSYVDVKTDQRNYERVIIFPKPYMPWMHVLQADDGNVVEVKTESIRGLAMACPF